MSNQQTIPISFATVQPVQRSPLVDTIVVTSERSATINYTLGCRIAGTPAVPAIPGVVGRGRIVDSQGRETSPAIDGSPAIPEVPAVLDTLQVVEQGSIVMTDDEWNAWKDQDDNQYRISIVATRLNLTINKS